MFSRGAASPGDDRRTKIRRVEEKANGTTVMKVGLAVGSTANTSLFRGPSQSVRHPARAGFTNDVIVSFSALKGEAES